jgi:hypothetical protein
MVKLLIQMGLFFVLIFSNMAYSVSNSQSACKDTKIELRCEGGQFNNLKYIGNVILSGTQVSQSTYTLGNFEAVNASLAYVYRTGHSYFQNTKVLEHFTHIGNIKSVSSTFGGPNDITGGVVANHSHFIESTIMAGNFVGDSNTFDDPVRIIGNFKGNLNIFHSQTEIIGTLQAKETQFLDRLLLTTTTSYLANSQTNDIFVAKLVGSCCVNQTLFLSNNTQVKGNITFYSGKGLVVLSSGAKITGQVRGGKVISREMNSV